MFFPSSGGGHGGGGNNFLDPASLIQAGGAIALITGKMAVLGAAAKSIYDYFEKFNDSVLSVNKNFGGTLTSINKVNSYSKLMYDNFDAARFELEGLGLSADELAKVINDISSQTGTMVGLSQKGAENYAVLAQKIGDADATTLTKNLISVGYSIESSANFMADALVSSEQMGLNSSAVSSMMVTNFKTMSRMNFKGGAKGIADMAKQSVMLGSDMGEVKRIADSLRKPEQAMEFSQKMQMLGGAFGSLFGDAFGVMKKARTDLPGLEKDIAKAAASMYKMNEEGQFVMDPEQIDILSEAATNFGSDLGKIQDMGEKMAKINYLKNSFSLGDMKDEDLNVLTGFIDFSKSKGGKVQFTGLDKLSDEMKAGIKLDDQGQIDLAKMDVEQMKILVNTLKQTDTSGKDSMAVMKDQVQASVNLTEQTKRLGEQMKSLSPDLTKILNKDTRDGQGGGTKGLGDEIRDMVMNMKQFSEQTFADGETGRQKLEEVLTKVKDDTIKNGLDPLKTAIEQLQTNLANGNANLTTTTKIFMDTMTTYFDKLKSLVGFKYGGIVKFNSGGILNGPSHEDGGIPAYVKGSGRPLELEGGEAIINKKSTEMFKPLLSKINEKGGGIRFEEGGITKSNLEAMTARIGTLVTKSNSTMDVRVTVNGTLNVDGSEITLTQKQKDEITKAVLPVVNSKIGKSSLYSANKPKNPKDDLIFG